MSRKRVYGTGSVYKESKTGKWKGQVYYTLNGEGRKKVFTRDTKRAAEKAIDEFVSQNKALFSSATRSRLNENIVSMPKTVETEMKTWLSNVKEKELKPTSFRRLFITSEQHIWPYIGRFFPEELTVDIIQTEIINRMVDKGLSPSSIKKARDAISSFLDYYIKKNALFSMVNVVKFTVLPKGSSRRTRALTENHYFTDEEIQKYMRELWRKRDDGSYVYKARTREILTVLPNTGLRISECLGLKWKDWDREAHILRIRRSTSQDVKFDIETGEIEKGSYRVVIMEDSTKTAAGQRTVPLNDSITKLLTERYEREHPSENDLMFPNDDGSPLAVAGLLKTTKSITKKIGCPQKTGLHIMRHTYASALLRAGVSERIVAEILGHANASITTDVYMHIVNELRFSENKDAPKFNPYPEYLIEQGLGMRITDK